MAHTAEAEDFPLSCLIPCAGQKCKATSPPSGTTATSCLTFETESHGCSANFPQFDYHFKSVLSFLSIDIFFIIQFQNASRGSKKHHLFPFPTLME